MLTQPSGFFERLPFGPYGVLPPQIFTRTTTPKLYFQSDCGRRAASSWHRPIFIVSLVPIDKSVNQSF